jgi:glutamine synthetase
LRTGESRGKGAVHGIDLARSQKKNGIKYFLISFVDLFGTMRAKIVPATAIDMMRRPAPASPASPPGST